MQLESLVTNLTDLSFNGTLFPFPFSSNGVNGQQSPTSSSSSVPSSAVSSAGINTTEYISFDHTFEDPIVVPILQADSGIIEDVTLAQGGSDTLNIVSLKYLDLINLDVYLGKATINGKLGITVNATRLAQDDVPTTYNTPFNKQGIT